jgi:hypothetical protein
VNPRPCYSPLISPRSSCQQHSSSKAIGDSEIHEKVSKDYNSSTVQTFSNCAGFFPLISAAAGGGTMSSIS